MGAKILFVTMFVILLAQKITYQAQFTGEHCGKTYDEKDPLNEGCETCESATFYKIEVKSKPAFLLRDDPVKKTQWTCLQCPTNSVSCEYKDGRVQVVECADKFYKFTAEDKDKKPLDDTCVSCPVNATKCLYDYGEKKVVVESCEDKFYILPGKKSAPSFLSPLEEDSRDDSCHSCPPNSLKCVLNPETNQANIEQCEEKYYLKKASGKEADQCISCPAHATGCTFDSETKKVTVTGCDTKFYLKKGKDTENDACVDCPAHSTGCRVEGEKVILDNCVDYYFIVHTQTTENERCAECPDNGCVMCDSATTCKVEKGCKVKYFPSGNTCKSCMSSCDKCQSTSTCDQCSAGFGYIKDKCTQCIKNCKSCEDLQSCKVCTSGYYVDLDGTCDHCSKKYHFCEQCNESECTVCEKDHELKDKFCSKEPFLKKMYFWIFFLALFVCFGLAACCMSIAKMGNRNREDYMETYDSDAY